MLSPEIGGNCRRPFKKVVTKSISMTGKNAGMYVGSLGGHFEDKINFDN